jgi:N-acylglucosamine-6-phosphate 2-epimerase
MSANPLLERLRGGLIVSVQAEAESVLNTPETIALLARCAVANGAAGLRIEGYERIKAVRAALGSAVPIVGIIKRTHPGFEPYITSTPDEVGEVADAGADIVAFDATARVRPAGATVADLVASAHGFGLLAMADCAIETDCVAATGYTGGTRVEADIVATTLAGYTAETRGRSLPDLDLVRALAARHPFTICEGGIGTPGDARAAFAAGASAVVVGTAITNIDVLVRRFAAAAPASPSA